MAEDVKDSSVMRPQNVAKRFSVGCRPVIGYTTEPKASGKNALTGSSATSLAARYGNDA